MPSHITGKVSRVYPATPSKPLTHRLERNNTLPRPAHHKRKRRSPRTSRYDLLKGALAKYIFKGKNRRPLEDMTNVMMKMNPLNAENEVPSRGKAMEIDSESTTDPLILHNPPSQEYANEEVNFLMKKMKAYLYYPRGKTMDEKQADFIKHIKDYDREYRELLEDIAKEIDDIIDKEQRKMGSGGGKEMHGGNKLTPYDLERLALLAIEYKRSILHDDLNELNKKTIGLTLTRINAAREQTEHNVLVQVPKECFDFNETKRIQVGASKFEYGILSTRHVYYFNTPKLESWLGKQTYTYPQLGTPSSSRTEKISNIVFRNNIVEYEVTKKSILENQDRMGAFYKRLNPEEKEFLYPNVEHFKTLLLKTKHVDKVFVSLRFHPGNRGHIIYTIKQFFKNIREQYLDPNKPTPIIHKGEQVLDRFGVFQLIQNDSDTDDKQTYGIKDVFKNLGVLQNDATNEPFEKLLEELDIDLRNGNFGQDAEANQTKMEDLGKRKIEIGKKIENLWEEQKNLEQEVKQMKNQGEGYHEGPIAQQINNWEGQIKTFESEKEKLEEEQEELNAEFDRLKNLGNTVDVIKEKIKQLIISKDSTKSPYTGLWFNLTIPGNHTWILFYVNKQFYSVGGGYNNDREYKLAFYSPDPVFDYANHWLFPLMMNNWGFIDKNIIYNLNEMAKSIYSRTSEGFVTEKLKYSLLSNRLSSLCGYYNCASTADKILGQSIPAIYSHPSFSRGGKYTYTSQVFEALNIDYEVERALSATERYQQIYSRLT